jgi:hypothetical protein
LVRHHDAKTSYSGFQLSAVTGQRDGATGSLAGPVQTVALNSVMFTLFA